MNTQTNQPLVSVIIPAFNEKPSMISLAIDSILKQTYQNIEIHIFDDSTKPETKEAIDAFAKDPRITIHRASTRIGFIKSLNMGLEAAKGKYIARMDGDDYSDPDRFQKEVEYLETHSQVMVVGGQMNIINENDQVISSRKYPQGGMKFFLFSCVRNPLAHPTVMIRREIVDKGYRYDETLRMSEDLDLWLRLMYNGYKLANIKDTVLNFRVMDNFLEKRSSDVQREVMAQVRNKNFDKRHLIHSLLSVFSGWLFNHVPRYAIDKAYQHENKGIGKKN